MAFNRSGIGLSITTLDETSCGSSTPKFDEANSKKEMNLDSSEEIPTDLLNENHAQESPFYSIKRNGDYIHAEAILKSPLFSTYRKTGTWDLSGTLQKTVKPGP